MERESNKVPEVEFLNPEDLVTDSDDEQIDEQLLTDEFEVGYEEGIEDGIAAATSEITHVKEHSLLERREDTRSTLAVIYTISTFIVFVLGMAIAVLDGIMRNVSIIDNLTEIIPLISGVFLGSLGFVLGYYFRKGEE